LNGAELSNAMVGAWRILTGDERARGCFDISTAGAARSFSALLLSLPVLFFSSTAAWRIARNTEGFPVDLPFGPFVTAEMLGTVIYWATFLLAMMRIAQALKLGHAYSAYLITFNWGTLFTSAIFALPLIPYSLGLYPETPALLLTLPALVILFVYHWRIARTVLGAEQGAAIAIVLFAAALSFSIDQVLGYLFLPSGSFSR
jgi:hypothetical protein